jgi:hypothetical protein
MNIRKKQAVALHEQVPYRVVAVKKSIFLLTVTA